MNISTKQPHPFRGPIILAGAGILLPALIGILLAIMGKRPECPAGYTQAQVDAANCVIGADMSFVWVIFALPFTLLAVIAAIIWAIIVQRRRR